MQIGHAHLPRADKTDANLIDEMTKCSCHWERGRGLTKLRKEGEYANWTQPNKEEKERQIPPSVTGKKEKCLEKEQGRKGICMT